MAIMIKEEAQYITFCKGNSKLYQILIADLDRPYLSGEYIVSHHVRMVSFCVWRDMNCLYQLGKIIQTKFPQAIKTINWPITYFNAEYDDYISKLATLKFSLGVIPSPTDQIDRIITEVFDIGEQERLNSDINRGIVEIVKRRLAEYKIIHPDT